jgi:hypothetical protein
MEGLSEVLATADVLYGLIPEAFTAARDQEVRRLRRAGSSARAVAVKDLRRPSVAAWLVNALVRHRDGEIAQLLDVGRALRDAQDTLDAGQLRELNRQRQAVLVAICRQARELASDLGRPVTEQVLSEVEETLRAALADPAAANAVRSGRLTAALKYAGFGDRDAAAVATVVEGVRTGDGAPVTLRAVPRRGSLVSPRDPAARDDEPSGPQTAAHRASVREATLTLRAAEDAAQRTEGAALAAEQHRDSLLSRACVARERLEAAHAQVAELESLLASARTATSTAAAAWAPLHAEAAAASTRADTARGLAESARAMLRAARAHRDDVERRSSAEAADTLR